MSARIQRAHTRARSDAWTVPTSTVYFPARLERAAKQLALDLGIKRTALAVGEMKRDRLTVILTADAPR